MTADAMDAMDDNRCDGCDGAMGDNSRFLKSTGDAAVLELKAPYPGDVHKSDICTNAWSVMGLELPKPTHRRSSKDLRGDELDEMIAI